MGAACCRRLLGNFRGHAADDAPLNEARSSSTARHWTEQVELAEDEPPRMTRRKSSLGGLHALTRSNGSLAEIVRRASFSKTRDYLSAELMDFENFDWTKDCLAVHEGSMKIVGCLSKFPNIALASVLYGPGDELLQEEVRLLSELKANGIRTIGFSDHLFDVKHYQADEEGFAKGYLLQYFSEHRCFSYEEGEPGTEDHLLEPMRKLKILTNDEGDWAMNRDTIRVIKEHNLEENFMEDLTAIVKFMLDKKVRIVDFQGVLTKDGHFYVADPLRLEPLTEKINKNLLEGVFMSSLTPQRQNKPKRHAFDLLGIDLGVDVPDEE